MARCDVARAVWTLDDVRYRGLLHDDSVAGPLDWVRRRAPSSASSRGRRRKPLERIIRPEVARNE